MAEKAIYWAERELLLIADLHLGKAAHFRKAGIAIPTQVEDDNLERLSSLILNKSCSKVILLGDLFHSQKNKAWDSFRALFKQLSEVQFTLIMGNHDILSIEDYNMKNFEIVPSGLVMEPFYLTHEPQEHQYLYNICGHIHPGIKLRGKGLQSLRLPCFSFAEKQAIMPAFGGFTGLYCIEPKASDAVFAIAEGEVVRI